MISNSVPIPLPPLSSLFSPWFLTISDHCKSTLVKREISRWVWGSIKIPSCGNVFFSQRVPSWQVLFWAGIPLAPSVTPCGLVVLFGLECKVSSWDTSAEHHITTPGLPARAAAAFPALSLGCLCSALVLRPQHSRPKLLITTSSLFHIPLWDDSRSHFFLEWRSSGSDNNEETKLGVPNQTYSIMEAEVPWQQ